MAFWKTISDLRPNRTLWFGLFVISLMSVYDIIAFNVSRTLTVVYGNSLCLLIGETCFAMLKATVLTYAYALMKRKEWSKILIISFLVFFTIASSVNFVSSYLFGRGISRTFFLILFETNPQESKEFVESMWINVVSSLWSVKTGIALVVLGVVYCAFVLLPLKWLTRGAAALSLMGLLFVGNYMLTAHWGRTSQIMTVRVPQFLYIGYRDYRSMQNAEKFIRPLPWPESAHTESLASDVVIVIGESSSRLHNSLYDYPIDTNRHTRSLKDSLYMFTDAIGSSSATVNNMPRILTFMPDSIMTGWYEYPSILQLFSELGYRTYWLSNQEKSGSVSNSSTSIASVADVSAYVGAMSSEDYICKEYDEALMPYYREALSDSASRRLIMLHLMGSHVQYQDRTPTGAKIISADDEMRLRPRKWLTSDKAQVCADYDNSVLYTDSLLFEMIRELRTSPRPSVFVYFSDHGEHIYDNRDHVGRDGTNVEVPFWVYLNQAYIDFNPEIPALLHGAVNRRLSTAYVIQMIMRLTGTTYKLYDERFDVLSQRYDSCRVRWVDESVWKNDL